MKSNWIAGGVLVVSLAVGAAMLAQPEEDGCPGGVCPSKKTPTPKPKPAPKPDPKPKKPL